MTEKRNAALARVEEIAAELQKLRRDEPDTDLARAYQIAIDRLHALAYRMGNRVRPVLVGGTDAPPPRTLPTIVIARNPNKRERT